MFQALLAQASASCEINGRPASPDECGKILGVFGGLGIFFLIIGLLSFIGWVVMLIHAIKHPIPNKMMWILLMVFVNITWIVYYFVVKRPFDKGHIQPETPGATAPSSPPVGPSVPPPAGPDMPPSSPQPPQPPSFTSPPSSPPAPPTPPENPPSNPPGTPLQ